MDGIVKSASINRDTVMDAIEENIQPENMDKYDRLVAAGMKVMYSEESQPIVQKYLAEQSDPATKAAKGALTLLGILHKESNQPIPPELLVPVGLTLLVEALDYLAQRGETQFTAELLDTATEIFVESLLTQMGITNEQLAEILAKEKA